MVAVADRYNVDASRVIDPVYGIIGGGAVYLYVVLIRRETLSGMEFGVGGKSQGVATGKHARPLGGLLAPAARIRAQREIG